MRSASEKDEAVYTLRVERSVLSRIHEIAANEHRTLSQKLRLMLEQEIARHDPQEDAA